MDRRHRREHGRVTAKGTRPGRSRPAGPLEPEEEPDLLGDVRAMVASDHPHELLTAGSHLVGIMSERPVEPVRPGEPMASGGPGLVEALIDADLPETTALLCAMAPLFSDELLAKRVRRALARRTHALPAWVWSLDRVEITTTWSMAHVLGDAEQVLIGARWPTGHEATAVVHVDFNLGTVAKNGFIVAEAVDRVVVEFGEAMAERGDTAIAPLEPAEARARIFQAIASGELSRRPFETDTWPSSRAAVEWLTARLPEGGTGYAHPEWTEAGRGEVVDAFLASEEGAPLVGDPDAVDLLRDVVWFGCDYGPGDPLRWSPMVCGVLLDGFLRGLDVRPAQLAGLPAVLRRFVAYAHRQRAIPAALTAETLAEVDAYTEAYRLLARRDHPGAEILLGRAAGDAGTVGGPDDEDEPFDTWVREALTEAVGGADALASLGALPLPDEPFDWDGVPEDIRPRVDSILGLVDRCCEERLDREYRTVCRRLLRRAACGDPEVFRRRARDDTAAAAIVWLAGKANGLFVAAGGDVFVKDQLAWFGITQGSVVQRASVLSKAAGLPGEHWSAYDVRFGDPGLLTSRRRSVLIRIRDRFMPR